MTGSDEVEDRSKMGRRRTEFVDYISPPLEILEGNAVPNLAGDLEFHCKATSRHGFSFYEREIYIYMYIKSIFTLKFINQKNFGLVRLWIRKTKKIQTEPVPTYIIYIRKNPRRLFIVNS